MKMVFVKHCSDIEVIIINALLTLEFFCNDKNFHDNGMQSVNMGFTSILSFLKSIGEHQITQSVFPRLLRVVCPAQLRE